MNNSKDRHIRRIVEHAEKDKVAQKMSVRRAVPSGDSNRARNSTQTQSEANKMGQEKDNQSRQNGGRTFASSGVKARVAPRNAYGSAGYNSAKGAKRSAVSTPRKVKKELSDKEKQIKKQEENQNIRIWIGVLFVFVAGLLILSTLSYFKYWKQDADIAMWGELLNDSAGGAKNWCGKLGAILGEQFVGKWFGVFGVGAALFFFFLAIKIFQIRNLKLKKSLRSTLVVIFLGSVVLGHFAGANVDVFGSGLGGEMGIRVAQWLKMTIGEMGTSLLLVLASIGALYYVNAVWFARAYNNVRATMDRYSHYKKLKNEAIELKNAKLAHENAIKREQLAKLNENNLQNGDLGNQDRNADNSDALNVEPKVAAATAATAEAAAAAANVVSENADEQEQNGGQSDKDRNGNVQLENIGKPQNSGETAKKQSVAAKIFNQVVTLENGQTAAVTDYNDDGSFNFLFVDHAAIASDGVENYGFEEDFKNNQNIEEDNDDFDDMYSVEEAQKNETYQKNEQNDQNFVERENVRQESLRTEESKKPVKIIESESGEPALVVEYMQGEDEIDEEVINQMELYDPTLELRNYKKPPVNLLRDHKNEVVVTDEELKENQERILYTLGTFGIKIDKIEAVVGPTVTLYEIIPAPGVRISKIKNLEDDIALALAALGIRIIAPMPGKGTIGIEVPNKEKEVVSMYSVIKSAKFQDSKADLPVAIGKTIQNETFVFDLAKMPHLLVAGATGQGKSVGLNAIITSLLYKKHPSELKFILVDPKKVELSIYALLEKHFLAKIPDAPEAIITDTQKVIYTLNSLCIEMDARYDMLKDASVRGIKEYNEKFIRRKLNPLKGHRYLPYFVVIIDEFADLIMTAGREVEMPIARIAQLARAVGIHLIIATQRPTTNIITGVIKANFPARIAFRVTSQIDSRTILDQGGANQLIGRGDMLISTGNELTRVQCAFVDTPEVELITQHIGMQKGYDGAYELPEYQPESESGTAKREDDGKRDPLFNEVARYVVDNQSGSASTIQRKFSIGFNRAGRIVDQLEAAGIVGKQEGSKSRQVLIQDVVTLEHIIER